MTFPLSFLAQFQEQREYQAHVISCPDQYYLTFQNTKKEKKKERVCELDLWSQITEKQITVG